jgi:hypothetical protein
MSLKKAHKLADAVLAVLELLFEDGEADGYSRTFHNGRENGYCVTLNSWTDHNDSVDGAELVHMEFYPGRSIFFAEHRISDGLICYCDEKGNTDEPSDEAWSNTMSFDRDEVGKAARAIFEWLKAGNVDKREPHPDYKNSNKADEELVDSLLS